MRNAEQRGDAMSRLIPIGKPLALILAGLVSTRAQALVYCVTNAVDPHQSAPTGALANSGWQETVPVGLFLGTVIATNALLTAKHLNFSAGVQFVCEAQTQTVISVANDPDSDLSVLFFSPGATQTARINIESNDLASPVVLQGRGLERGGEVIVGGHTNGWKWAWDRWWGIRRWGVNRYIGGAESNLLAVAAFGYTNDPDVCMLSPGDSGGPGFVRTGSGWKVATVNYSVDPSSFTLSTNPVASFDASLFDCAGLYYNDGTSWRYVPPEDSPAPCLMINTRIAARVAWITNTVAGLTFPADIGVAWRFETNQPSARQAADGLWFEAVASNAGPYTARDLTLEIAWAEGVRVRAASATTGAYASGRWSVPCLEDGGAATLRVDAAVWRAESGWGSNRVAVTASDKPDGVSSNNTAWAVFYLPATATRLLVQ